MVVNTLGSSFPGAGGSRTASRLSSECRQWKRRLTDLLPYHDTLKSAVRAWVNQLELFS
jgi:hypothetical protein